LKFKMETIDLNVWYGRKHVLRDVCFKVPEKEAARALCLDV